MRRSAEVPRSTSFVHHFSCSFLILILAIGSASPGRSEITADAEPQRAEASDADADADAQYDEVIVVTATRDRRALSNIPVSVTVISREEVEQAPAKAVDDLLRTVPGINLPAASSIVSHPTSQSVSLRGLGRTRALVQLDGIPLNDGFGGWVNWTKVPYRNIEQIEVVRGGSSSSYGTYAMGGVINILTRPMEGRVLEAEGSYGSQNTGRMNAYASEEFRDTRVSVAYDYFTTDGYKVVPKSERGSVDDEADSEHHNLRLGLDHQIHPDASIFLRANFFTDDRNVGTPLADDSRDTFDAAMGTSVSLANLGDFQASVFGEVQKFDNNNVRVSPDRSSEVKALTQDIPTWDVGVTAQWSRAFAPWSSALSFGVDFRHIDGENKEKILNVGGVVPGRTKAGGKQQALGVFTELSLTPIENLELLGSLRLDYWRNFDAFRRDQSGVKTTFSSKSETEVSPRLSARYGFGESWAVRGAVYRSFRAPTLNEMYRGFFAGNTPFLPDPDLGPEILEIGGEVGIDFRRWMISARVTGLWNQLEDTIAFTTVTPFPNLSFQRQNFGETRSRGFEAEAQIDLSEDIAILPSYVFTEATIREYSPDPNREGNWIPNIPRHQVNLTLRYDNPEIVTLSLRGRYLGKRYADDRNTQRLSSFFVLDVSASRQFGEHWELFLVGENVTDKTYRASQTGRTATLGAPLQVWAGVRFSY